MQLAADPTRADLVIDASNVCSRDVLGGQEVALSRLQRAVDVFERWAGIPTAVVAVVADNSLRKRLASAADRRLLAEWVDKGVAESVPGADERILEIVELAGIPAMTWDKFEGHRDAFPWVQGDTEHFIIVVPDGGGRLTIALRDMGVVSPRRISERAEVDALKAARLLDRDGRPDAQVLSRWWRCPDRRCSLFPSDRRRGQPFPLRDGGKLVCSLHRLPLADDGPRQPELQVKVVYQGKVCQRLVLQLGQPPAVLGRGSEATLDLTPLVRKEDAELLSRRHIELRVEGDHLAARDPGSTNGSSVIHGRTGRATRLVAGDETSVDARDGLDLAGVVKLEVSGRRFPPPEGRRVQPRGRTPAADTRLA